jgi:hypothetical protein
MLEDRGTERREVAVARLEHIDGAPSERTQEPAADGTVHPGRKLADEVVADEGDDVRPVRVRVGFGRDDRIGQLERSGREGRASTATAAAVGSGRRGRRIRDGNGVDVSVEDAEANAGLGQVSADGEFDGGEALVGERVSAGDDGEDVHARREAPDRVDLSWCERGAGMGRVGRHGGLENQTATVREGSEKVCKRSGK